MFGAPSLGVRAFALKRKNRGPFEDQLTLVQDGMIIQALRPFPELKEFDFVLDVGDLKTDITTLQVVQDDKFRKVLQGLEQLVTVSPKELQGPERNYELLPAESPS